jgi:alpha-glucosidase
MEHHQMIRLELKDNEYHIYYNDHKFFSHSKKNPLCQIGVGEGKYKQNHSAFNIRENLKQQIALKEISILSQDPNALIIELSHRDYKLSVEFTIQDQKLYIYPKCDHKEINRFWIHLNAEDDEGIFGCGEQFTDINHNGKKIPIWVEDASPPTRSKHTYYPQPNFISSHHYYCHIDTTYYTVFDFTQPNKHELYIWNIPQQITIGKFDNLLETVQHLNKFLGIQPKPADWIYDGIWLGIQGGPEIVDKKIDTALTHNIKVAGVWCQDWQGTRFTSFGKQLFWNWKYDEKIYPNLPEYIKKLNSKGIHFLGYINTMLAIEGNLYKEASEKGYCLKNEKGEDYYTMMTDFPAAQIDFSNPDAVEWIKSVIKKNMIGIGMNGWMVDYGEYVPVDAVPHSGMVGEAFHNFSPTLWNKLNYEAVKEENLQNETIYFTRSGFTGSSKYTMMHFSGDQRVDWDEKVGLPTIIPSSINMGMCGIGYYHFDIGCYTTYREYKRTKELFMRSAEIAAFTMLMRTHEGNRPDVNWQFDSDEETIDHLKKMVQTHLHLTPYLKYLSNEYQQLGTPLVRGCFMHYENDKEVYHLKYQFMLGKDLLIAPVIKPGIENWKVYLPDDLWVHLWSGVEFGGGWNEVYAPIGQPPVFYRKDSNFFELFSELSQNKK